MTNGPSVRLQSVHQRAPRLPVLVIGIAVGILIGLGLPQVVAVAPKATTTSGVDMTSSRPVPSSWITPVSVASELMQAYYAVRVTSAGLAAVVCSTAYGVACQGVPAHEISHVEGPSPAPQLPGPNELWSQLPGIAHVNGAGNPVDVIVIDDLSPALFSQVVVLVASPDQTTWSSGATVAPLSVNGAVAVTDLGDLVRGAYLVLVRQIFSVPPDPHGLVESWKAIGVEVG